MGEDEERKLIEPRRGLVPFWSTPGDTSPDAMGNPSGLRASGRMQKKSTGRSHCNNSGK